MSVMDEIRRSELNDIKLQMYTERGCKFNLINQHGAVDGRRRNSIIEVAFSQPHPLNHRNYLRRNNPWS